MWIPRPPEKTEHGCRGGRAKQRQKWGGEHEGAGGLRWGKDRGGQQGKRYLDQKSHYGASKKPNSFEEETLQRDLAIDHESRNFGFSSSIFSK